MIRCTQCRHPVTDVIDSRPHGEGIRRRRECRKCHHRFNTKEHAERMPTHLYPIDQKALDLLTRHYGWSPQTLQQRLQLKSRQQLSTVILRLRMILHGYGYTITKAPYRLKVLED